MRTLTPWARKALPVKRQQEDYPLYGLQREMNDLFNDFFRGFDLAPWGSTDEVVGEFIPRIDMHESDKEITLSAELPGLVEKDLNVSISKDILTISGEKKSEKIEDAKGHYKMERTYGSFRRSVSLPAEVDSDQATASYKNGVLTVNLPKTKESQKAAKAIPVKAT